MHVGEYCNRDVVVGERGMDVREAARLMRHHHVGDLIIVERAQALTRPVGVITDRDLVVEVLAQDVAPEQLKVADIMSAVVETANEFDDVLETLRRMRKLGVRRMPVVDSRGGLAGIVAVDDLLGLASETLQEIAMLISRQIRQEEKHRP